MIEALIFITGAIIGSFFNVVIHRLPRGESIISPPSHCPHCGRKIKWWQNIPILSYIILKGKCFYCKEKISIRYPLVEFITGASALLIFKKTGLSPQLIWAEVFLLALIPAFFIDLDHQILPDEITIGTAIWGLFCSLTHMSGISITQSLLGILICGGAFLLVAILSKGGMGLGDVKLAASFGANFGWKLGLISLFLSVFLGAVVGVALILLRKKGRKDRIPFGPFMIIGAYLTFYFGGELLKWYLELSF